MREMDEQSAKSLPSGGEHYTAYVGPPSQYDFMGATQFALLCSLGLREHHKVLDFGCGSLRGGRLLIPYLNPGCYFGIEPNAWLIEDAIERQLGQDIIKIKRPHFSHSSAFVTDVFGERFDFIIAQSIFSHSGPEMTARALRSLAVSLAPGGLCAVTFIEGDSDTPEGWHYPGVVKYRRDKICELLSGNGVAGIPVPWFHPRQQWWVLAMNESDLPSPADTEMLRGFRPIDGKSK